MKKLALLLVLTLVLSYGVVFADIINPNTEAPAQTAEEVVDTAATSAEEGTPAVETEATEEAPISGEQEATSTPAAEESSNTVIEPEKTANPIGGIIAIVVVVVLVGLVALVSKK